MSTGGKLVPDKNFAQFCLKSPLEFVFPKNTFSVWIFVLNHTSPMLWAKRFRWRGWGQKWSRSEVSSIPKNTFSFGIFRRNRPHTSFLGLIGYIVCSGAKLFRTKTLLNFASKALSNSFFQKSRFWFEFLYKIAPHLFSWPNGLDGTIMGKSVPQWSFVHPKKHVFGWNFLKKPAPYVFSGSNWLYGAFGGKIVPDENFA